LCICLCVLLIMKRKLGEKPVLDEKKAAEKRVLFDDDSDDDD
jgi:hypothetical protein